MALFKLDRPTALVGGAAVAGVVAPHAYRSDFGRARGAKPVIRGAFTGFKAMEFFARRVVPQA